MHEMQCFVANEGTKTNNATKVKVGNYRGRVKLLSFRSDYKSFKLPAFCWSLLFKSI